MQTPVIVAWIIAVLIEVLFPVALAIWFQRRYRVGWRVFVYGALIFFLFQMITRVPLVQIVNRAMLPRLQSSQALMAAYYAGVALTAGLFESVGRWVGYKWLFRRRLPRDWANGVAYGIGHAAIESVLLVGLSSALALAQAVQMTTTSIEALKATFPAELPAQLLEQMLAAREQYLTMAWYDPLWGALERLSAIPFHVGMSLLVLLAFARGQARWLWAAVGLHTLLDFTAPALAQIVGTPIWALELYIALWGALGIWLTLRLKKRLPSASE